MKPLAGTAAAGPLPSAAEPAVGGGQAAPVPDGGLAPTVPDGGLAPPVPASRTPAKAAWVDERERSNMLALRLMSWIALRCGRRIARWVLYPIALYFILLAPAKRRISRDYLKRVLGRDANWVDGFRHVFCFASTVLDRVYLLRGQIDWLDLKAEGTALVDAQVAGGQGAFLMGAHIGSFEALRTTAQVARDPSLPPLDITMLMFPDNARKINAALAAIAPDTQPQIIALGRPEAMLAVRDKLAAGGLIGVLADRTLPTEGQRGNVVWLPFLGSPAPFSDGPFRLAELLRQRILFMVAVYAGGGRYEARFEPLADFSQRLRDPAARDARLREAMQAYVARLEALCHEHPYNWFNFHDFWHEQAH